MPPSPLDPATRLRAPPFDQRSCCQAPTKLDELTQVTDGSTSALRWLVPVWWAVEHVANGFEPETRTEAAATAGGAPSAAATTAETTTKRFMAETPLFKARLAPLLRLDRSAICTRGRYRRGVHVTAVRNNGELAVAAGEGASGGWTPRVTPSRMGLLAEGYSLSNCR